MPRDRRFAWCRNTPVIAALLATAAVPACDDGRPAPHRGADLGASAAALTDSEDDAGHPAIVTFIAQNFVFCTGTVIAPRVILTAGHCTDPELTGVQPEEIEAFFGNDVREEGTTVRVIEGHYHPDWNPDDLYNGYDIGVFILGEDAPAEPMAIGAAPPEVGDEPLLVGFGFTAPGEGGGVKRRAVGLVSDVQPFLFDLSAERSDLCMGDSGGPALLAIDGVETIVGLGSLGSCGGASVEQRVDIHLESFVLPFLATCEADDLCAADCEEPDPDCAPVCEADGVCDEACAEGADPDCDTSSASETGTGTGSGTGVGPGTGTGAGTGGADEGSGGSAAGDGSAAEDDGGCAVGPAPSRSGGAFAAALAIALIAARSRRRSR